MKSPFNFDQQTPAAKDPLISAKRQVIPITIQRQVFVETAFRCPICNRLSPLEIHHITPYRFTKVHRYGNLIAICTECHNKLRGRELDVSSKLLDVKRNLEQHNVLSFDTYVDSIDFYEFLADQGVYDKRIVSKLYRRLTPLFKQNPALTARTTLAKAQVAKHRGQVRAALWYASCALSHFSKLSDQSGTARALHLIGGIHFIREDFSTALAFYKQAEAAIESIPFLKTKRSALLFDIWRDIGITYSTLGDSNTGLSYNERSLVASEASGSRQSYALALMDRGKVLTANRKPDFAFDCLAEGEKELPSSSVLPRVMLLNFYANLFRRERDYDKSALMISLSKRYSRVFGFTYEMKTALRNEEGLRFEM